jgi:beta-carotene 3-hydroxylase
MSTAWIFPAAIVVTTVLIMELVAAAVHRFIMHGWGWRWHRSHHEPRAGRLEKNDLFGLIFAGFSLLLFVLGANWPLLWWIGLGMLVYGLLYAVLHDGFVHRRLPMPRLPRNGYLKRLIQAHRLHHAACERDGAVSFGFLYAPPVQRLRTQWRSRGAGR